MMRRRGFTKWELLIVFGVIGVLAIFIMPSWHPPRQNARRASCQSNLKQVGLGILQYSQDFDEKIPLINVNDAAISETNPLGWVDALYPYTKSNQIFWCPSQESSGQRNSSMTRPSDRDYTDYFLNRRLAGIDTEKNVLSTYTIMLGEGNDGTDAANARYSLSTLPAAWIANKESPLYRHLEGANYLFADGHVKFFRPTAITNKKPDGSIPTFAIK